MKNNPFFRKLTVPFVCLFLALTTGVLTPVNAQGESSSCKIELLPCNIFGTKFRMICHENGTFNMACQCGASTTCGGNEQ